VIVAKKYLPTKHIKLAGYLTRDLAGNIVAKKLCYCSKADLSRDIIKDLAGAKKKIYYRGKIDFARDNARDHAENIAKPQNGCCQKNT
jgi:hypothetical protein